MLFSKLSLNWSLPAIPGECASNENPPSEKLRKSFSRSRCKSSCSKRSSLPPPDVEPGLCCSDKLLGTGECVPSEMSESESSDGVGDELSCPRLNDVPPDPDNGGWFILKKDKKRTFINISRICCVINSKILLHLYMKVHTADTHKRTHTRR